MQSEPMKLVDADGISADIRVTVADPLDAFNMLSNRLYCEGQMLEALSIEHYNGYGQAFDSLHITDVDIEHYRNDYRRLQASANQQGISIDLLTERLALTKSLLDGLHNFYLQANELQSKANYPIRGATRAEAAQSSVGRAAEQHRATDWAKALEAFQTANTGVTDAVGDEATDAAADVQHTELEVLMRTRAPDLDALREKVRIARAELGDTTYSVFTNLLADIDRLN